LPILLVRQLPHERRVLLRRQTHDAGGERRAASRGIGGDGLCGFSAGNHAKQREKGAERLPRQVLLAPTATASYLLSSLRPHCFPSIGIAWSTELSKFSAISVSFCLAAFVHARTAKRTIAERGRKRAEAAAQDREPTYPTKPATKSRTNGITSNS